MGFFKKLFKKKENGTFFGNLLRGAANKATGGLLGNGVALQAWQAKQDQKLLEQQQADYIKQQQAQQIGGLVGSTLQPHFNQASTNSTLARGFQNQQIGAWAKRNWYFIAIPVVAVTGLIIYLFKKKRK